MPGERIDAAGARALRRARSHAGWRRRDSGARRAGSPRRNPLAFLMTPADRRDRRPRQLAERRRIALFHAGGREAEIEEVFRRILATGASLDQVEIACASDAHVALVWEKALRHDWPVTLGPGIPAASTRPGRALIGLCDWIETDFSAGHFRRLLQSGDLGVDADDEGFTAGQAARTARARRGRLGTRDLRPRARAAAPRATSRAPRDPDESDDDRADARGEGGADRTRRSRGSPRSSRRFPSRRPTAQVPLQTVVDAALEFLEHTTARRSALDHRAASALARPRRRAARARRVLVLAARGAALHPRTRPVAAGRARASAPRSSLRLHARRRPATPAARISSSSVSKKAACSRPRPRMPCCSTPSAPRISPALRLSTDRIDEAVYGRRWRRLARRGRAGDAAASRSAIRAATRASSARPTRPG